MANVGARWVCVSTMPDVVGGVGRWRYSSGGVVDFFLAIMSELRNGVVEDIERELKDLQLMDVAMREDDMCLMLNHVIPHCDYIGVNSL